MSVKNLLFLLIVTSTDFGRSDEFNKSYIEEWIPEHARKAEFVNRVLAASILFGEKRGSEYRIKNHWGLWEHLLTAADQDSNGLFKWFFENQSAPDFLMTGQIRKFAHFFANYKHQQMVLELETAKGRRILPKKSVDSISRILDYHNIPNIKHDRFLFAGAGPIANEIAPLPCATTLK